MWQRSSRWSPPWSLYQCWSSRILLRRRSCVFVHQWVILHGLLSYDLGERIAIIIAIVVFQELVHRDSWTAVVSDELGYDVRGTSQLQSECVITHLDEKEKKEKKTRTRKKPHFPRPEWFRNPANYTRSIVWQQIFTRFRHVSFFPSTQELRSCNVKLIQCVCLCACFCPRTSPIFIYIRQ